MFSPNDILTLSKAGFTAQQIAGLSMIANQQSAPAVQAPAVQAPAVPAPAVPAPVVPAPAVPAPAVQAPAVDPVLAELQKLTGLMQNGNIVGSNMPQPQTPEEILAEIINPPIKKE